MATFDPIPLDGDPEGPTDLTSLMTEMDETLALGKETIFTKNNP